jgi:hypothetical protein
MLRLDGLISTAAASEKTWPLLRLKLGAFMSAAAASDELGRTVMVLLLSRM